MKFLKIKKICKLFRIVKILDDNLKQNRELKKLIIIKLGINIIRGLEIQI